jgi:DNA adenine methylase
MMVQGTRVIFLWLSRLVFQRALTADDSKYPSATMMNSPLSIQPIPYQGSKRALAPRICSLFPEEVETLYEPFAGSAAVTLFAASHDLAEHFIIGDIYVPLVDLWELIIENPGELSDRYSALWHGQIDNPLHFNDKRAEFNKSGDPVLLLYLVARCVKNAVRFNRHGNFTQSADKRRMGMKPDRVTRTAHAVSRLLKGRTSLFRGDFRDCVKGAGVNDLIYMDPPYQGTTYGADKRYAAGLERDRLIDALHEFDARSVPYVLSYDGQTGEKTYGEPLPKTVDADYLAINAGRSSQATISGRTDETIESLYIARSLDAGGASIYKPRHASETLFV